MTDRPQVFIPWWIKSFRASVMGREAEVIRIPDEEFGEPDITVRAEDFPEDNEGDE